MKANLQKRGEKKNFNLSNQLSLLIPSSSSSYVFNSLGGGKKREFFSIEKKIVEWRKKLKMEIKR